MPSERGPWRRYGFALAAALCALVLTRWLWGYLQPVPAALLAAAALASAWYGGAGPGVLSTVLTVALAFTVLPITVPAEPTWVGRFTVFLIATALLGRQSTANRRARAALHFLADAGKSLSASLDYQTTVTTAAQRVVPELADGCIVDLVAEDGSVACAAVAHSLAGMEPELRHAAESQAPLPHTRGGVADVLRTGQSLLLTWLPAVRPGEPEEPRRRALRALGARSLLIVPLRARGRTLGALTLLSSRLFRRLGRGDQTVAIELAQRAALAIDNARLYGEARQMEEALRERAEQLAAADRLKDEFLAIVAHELRGPLAALRGAVEALRSPAPNERAADKPQGIMARQIEALARLVDDLLDVARITQGKIALQRQGCELLPVLHAAVGTARPIIDERHHTLTLTLPQASPRIEADPGRLEQVFVNLLTNAAKYTEPGGHIWLSAAIEQGAERSAEIIVSVRDTGVGIHKNSYPGRSACLPRDRKRPACRAAWASAWRWSAGWSRCTAAALRHTATAPAREASSSCVCRF
jgi:signal transduction histidine kinase